VADADVAVEFLIEPFVEGVPGSHVDAALAAFTSRGLSVDLGPFSSVSSGSLERIGEAIGAMVVDAMRGGATHINLSVARDTERLAAASLHDALDAMMRAAQRDLGGDASTWSRADKQRVVRMLDERGAFLLRGAVDDIAVAMGVSRITIYNYLNAINSGSETASNDGTE